MTTKDLINESISKTLDIPTYVLDTLDDVGKDIAPFTTASYKMTVKDFEKAMASLQINSSYASSSTSSVIDTWLSTYDRVQEKKATAFIEENINLIEENTPTALRSFFEKCPYDYIEQVITILKKADIFLDTFTQEYVDRKVERAKYGANYTSKNPFLNGSIYMHDQGTYSYSPYTTNLKQYDISWIDNENSLNIDDLILGYDDKEKE